MDVVVDLQSLFWIALAAGVAPLVVARLPGPRIPEVALLLVLGVVIGPPVLGLATVDPSIQLISNIGMGFLFFTAGYELDVDVLRGRTGRLAIASWGLSVALALLVVGVLYAEGEVAAFVPVSIALTSTALGTLLPILRDHGLLPTALGRSVLASGAVGEFGPVVAISLFLGSRGAWESLLLLLAFGVVAVVVDRVPRRFWNERLSADFARGYDSTAQTAVRWCIVLLLGLLVVAADFGLDMILGAFAAGLILRRLSPTGEPVLESKIDGLAFGFFIPVFFVVSGMTVDLASIAQDPARLVIFFVLLALVRGLPTILLFRRELPRPQPWQLGLFTATGLPIIVAITQIAVASGEMLPTNAAALVGAGLLTVLLFPATATLLGERGGQSSPVPAAPVSGSAAE
jgi:Kef-type K+ transport system membrane component KefB